MTELFEIYEDTIRISDWNKFESDRIYGVRNETESLEPFMTFKEANECCALLNKLITEIIKLKTEKQSYQEKMMILTEHLLSDEANLTDKQIKKIRQEIERRVIHSTQ